jgi:hypothetical protein
MKAYVTKVLFQFELGVLCHKNICHEGPCHLAYVTWVYNIIMVVVIMFDVNVIKVSICHSDLCELGLFHWILCHLKHVHEGLRYGTCVVSFCTSLSYSSTSCATPSNSYQSQYNDCPQQNKSYLVTWDEDSPLVLITLYYLWECNNNIIICNIQHPSRMILVAPWSRLMVCIPKLSIPIIGHE